MSYPQNPELPYPEDSPDGIQIHQLVTAGDVVSFEAIEREASHDDLTRVRVFGQVFSSTEEGLMIRMFKHMDVKKSTPGKPTVVAFEFDWEDIEGLSIYEPYVTFAPRDDEKVR